MTDHPGGIDRDPEPEPLTYGVPADPYEPPAGYQPPSDYAPPSGYGPPPGYPPASGSPFAQFPGATLTPAPPAVRREPWIEPGDLRAAAVVVAGLAVMGVLAGVLWGLHSPHATGIVVTRTEIIPLEQENWIAADGRYAIITAIIGVIAGVAAWFWRSRRGPVLAVGVAAGAVLGALLTALVGYWLSSGHTTGKVNTEIRLRVLLHAHGLIAVEAVLAVGAYLTAVLFSGPDDLGRAADQPTPSHLAPMPGDGPAPSVPTQD